jgi:hypothetical protein
MEANKRYPAARERMEISQQNLFGRRKKIFGKNVKDDLP